MSYVNEMLEVGSIQMGHLSDSVGDFCWDIWMKYVNESALGLCRCRLLLPAA
jgi:hypothetical protein